ncbi:MAG: patatin-like phospholipase family protein [archaeon]|jgi:predicted patatin/cPLA2 family phospholipase
MVTRDIILIVEGGAMSGVFGAGVLKTLNKDSMHSRVHSIYSVSAGAHNAAFFLSRNATEGSEIYTKELISKRSKFINMDIKELISNFWKLLFLRRNLHLMDLDVLREIEKTKRKLDYQKIKNSPINFYVAVFDKKTMKLKYLNGKKDTLEVINLSSYLAPYIYLNTKSNDIFDGGTIPSDCFLKIVKENKDKKIIWIINENRIFINKMKDSIFDIVDLYAKSMYFGFWYMVHHLFHFFDTPSIETIKKYSNVIVVHPNCNVRKVTRNKKEMVDLYYHGVNKGKEILKKLNIK